MWILTSTLQGTASQACPNPSGGTASAGDGVVYTGTSPIYWQNVGPIRGPQGSNGSQGSQGIQGSQGDQGSQGFQGQQGNQGEQGNQGFQGQQGSQGHQGNQGFQGNQGNQGYRGDSTGETYYFNYSVASDVNGYKELSITPIATAQQMVTTSLPGKTDNILIASFITPQLGFSVIPGGSQLFHQHFLKQASNDHIQTYITIQLANSTGTPIGPILSTNAPMIGWTDSTNAVETLMDLVLTTTTIDPTNRMIVKIYANNDDNTSHSLKWYTEGTAYYSFARTTVSVVPVIGEQGFQGFQGNQGSQGSQGEQGFQGDQGSQGEQGFQGNQGSQGNQGDQGNQGNQGEQGDRKSVV
jgi:hypothetical protein